MPIDYVSCTKSRHELQWFQKPLPLAEFIIHQIFVLFIIIATIYHIRFGEQTGLDKIFLNFYSHINIENIVLNLCL